MPAAGPKLLIQARLARLKGDVATARKDNSLAVKYVIAPRLPCRHAAYRYVM
jgi:hypothetical protein